MNERVRDHLAESDTAEDWRKGWINRLEGEYQPKDLIFLEWQGKLPLRAVELCHPQGSSSIVPRPGLILGILDID